MDDLKRDRTGEIFQDDLTDNEGATPAAIEQASHTDKLDPNVDSQEDDATNPEFAEELKKSGHASGH